MSSTLKHFFSTLTSDQTNEIALNLITKYFEYTSLQQQSKLHSLFLLLNTKLKSFHHLLLMKSLYKWEQKKQQAPPPPPPSIIIPSDFNSSFVSKAIIPSHNNSGSVNYNKIKQNKINMNTHYKIGNTNNITTKIKLTKKKANRSVSSIEEKSWDRRERESLEECTFNPVINKKYNVRNQCVDNCRSNNKALVFERLYKDKERYDKKTN